jgi:CBS domain-containing protein
MLVREVMSAPAITVAADLPVKEGLRLLDKHRVTALPVTDDEGRLIGIVSEVDLLRDAVRHDDRAHLIPHEEPDPRPKRIEDVMSVLSMTVGLDSDLSDAVELMTSTAVKSVPVVDGGKVVGVVSRSDVVHLLARSDDQIHAEVDEMLRSAGLECEVEVVDGRVRLAELTDPHERRIAEVLAGSVSGVIGVVHG